MKKLLNTLLTLLMVACFSVGVLAEAPASTHSIEVNNAQAGETYKIYKMLDVESYSKDEDGNPTGKYAYKINSDWTDFFTAEGTGASYISVDATGYVQWKEGMNDADKMEAFGKAAAEYAKTKPVEALETIEATKVGENPVKVTFDGLAAGYYLITSTGGTKTIVGTTPTTQTTTITEKNGLPVVDKKVDENGTWTDESHAQIGHKVDYKSVLTIKPGAVNYVYHDKMSEGLTLIPETIQITGLVKDTDYTVVTEASELADGCTFEIKFAKTYLDTIKADTDVTILYSATLNENAKVETSETNMAKPTWGNKGEGEWDTVETKTHQFAVLKYAFNDSTKAHLAGAEFKLYEVNDETETLVKLIKVSDTEYRVAMPDEEGAQDTFVTVATGNIVISGLDVKSYKLEEIKAPEGFNLPKDKFNVTVNADNLLVKEIANASGTELPTTGGMGTTLFYTVGGLLVLGSIVLLVTKRRMDNQN